VGLLHPYSTPSQAVFILGLGCLAGGFDLARARWLLGVFLAASLSWLFLRNEALQPDSTAFALAFLASAWVALGPGKLRSHWSHLAGC